jgi:hypothetical protein
MSATKQAKATKRKQDSDASSDADDEDEKGVQQKRVKCGNKKMGAEAFATPDSEGLTSTPSARSPLPTIPAKHEQREGCDRSVT